MPRTNRRPSSPRGEPGQGPGPRVTVVDRPAAEGRDQSHACCDAEHFTIREVEVLAQLAAGRSTEQAAEALCISPHTVTHHIGRMLVRTGAANRAELVARGYLHGALVAGSWPPSASGLLCLARRGPAGLEDRGTREIRLIPHTATSGARRLATNRPSPEETP